MESALGTCVPGFDRRTCGPKGLMVLLIAVSVTSAGAAGRPGFTVALAHVFPQRVVVDGSGNTYVAGTTGAAIPTTPGAFQTTFAPKVCIVSPFPLQCQSAYVMKLDPAGSIVWATYLNGSYGSSATGVAVDSAGDVYITGSTSSADFPLTPGAAFTTGTFNAGFLSNGFIAKLNGSGTGLLYSTLIPDMSPLALAIDAAGSAYVGGFASAGFRTTDGAFEATARNPSQPYSGAVLKLKSDGSALLWSTFLCGTVPLGNGDSPASIAVDGSGNVAVAGFTAASDFPVTPGALEVKPPASKSTYLSVLNPTGSALVFSTYLSDCDNRNPTVRFDPRGGIYVLGEYGRFPVTGEAFQPTAGGPFLAHFSSTGILLYATYLPIQSASGGEDMDLDSAGNLYVVGAGGPGLLTTGGAFQAASAGAVNCYIMKFTPDGQLLGATYLGGSSSDEAAAIAAVGDGSVVVAGITTSSDFPGAGTLAANAPGYGFVTSIFPAVTLQNAASFSSGSIAPGEIVAIRAYGIGPAAGQIAKQAGDESLPVSLAGVTVTFGGVPAPLVYAQDQQINVQVPWEIARRTSVAVQISYQGTVGAVPVPVAAAAPGVFYINNSDGSKNSTANPARSGDFVTLYGTGGGLTDPVGITGAVWPVGAAYPVLREGVTVTVGGASATVLYAGASPLNETGVFQINVMLPGNLPAGTTILKLQTGSTPGIGFPLAVK